MLEGLFRRYTLGASIESLSTICHTAFIPYLAIAFFHFAGSFSEDQKIKPTGDAVDLILSTSLSLTVILQQFSSKKYLRRIMQQPFELVNLLCGCAS